jgi:hypothetical protein
MKEMRILNITVPLPLEGVRDKKTNVNTNIWQGFKILPVLKINK